jgi:hypothetical protein
MLPVVLIVCDYMCTIDKKIHIVLEPVCHALKYNTAKTFLTISKVLIRLTPDKGVTMCYRMDEPSTSV